MAKAITFLRSALTPQPVDHARRKPQIAVVGIATVDQSDDMRMSEGGNDTPFMAQSVYQIGVAAHQLERHLLLEPTVGTLGQIDVRHAAGAHQFDDAPGPDTRAGPEDGTSTGLADQLLEKASVQCLAGLESIPGALTHLLSVVWR